jgi:hypothetical protein
MLTVIYADSHKQAHSTECPQGKCHYAEYHNVDLLIP